MKIPKKLRKQIAKSIGNILGSLPSKDAVDAYLCGLDALAHASLHQHPAVLVMPVGPVVEVHCVGGPGSDALRSALAQAIQLQVQVAAPQVSA